MKILLILFISMSLVACSTAPHRNHPLEVMKDVINVQNDGALANLDTKGNPYNKIIYSSEVGPMGTTIIKTVLYFVVDQQGLVYIDPKTNAPVMANIKYFEYADKGWVERIVLPLANTAAQTTMMGLIGTGAIGRCRGCGGGGGVVNYNTNNNSALSGSDASTNVVTETTVGCATGHC